MKRVFIIHGWSGYPNEGWFPWLKRELEKRKFGVEVPAMPNPDCPKIDTWIPFLNKLVKEPDLDTYFVGHSIGCQTILRYLEKLEDEIKIGGCVLVAGWFGLNNLTEEEEIIAKPWLNTNLDFGKIRKTTKNFVAIFSDNDPVVPLTDSKILLEKNLCAKTVIEHNKGHFSGSDHIKRLPIVLNEILNMPK